MFIDFLVVSFSYSRIFPTSLKFHRQTEFFFFLSRVKFPVLKGMRLHDLVPSSSETLSQCMAWTSVCLLTLPRFIVGRSWNFYGLKRNFPPLGMFRVLSSTVLPIAET